MPGDEFGRHTFSERPLDILFKGTKAKKREGNFCFNKNTFPRKVDCNPNPVLFIVDKGLKQAVVVPDD